MSNSYFQFKQFRVEQDRCAMKVTTDACIQGAWTPVLPGVKDVLDIGTGTGLLTLMLAQKSSEITVDAIEVDKDAAGQARANVAGSPWRERINILEGDVRNYPFDKRYDLIITNPPFFSNSLLGDDVNKNLARHTLQLSFAELLNAANNCLKDDGYVSILLPIEEYGLWKTQAENDGWHEVNALFVRHTAQMPVKRVVGLFCKKSATSRHEKTLVIKGEEQNYTADFIELLSPYYLHL